MRQKYKSVFFVGIGGIGMSALARYFKRKNYNVAGYDKTPSKLTSELQEEGISIHFEDDISFIEDVFKKKEETLIVYTPAIPKNHKELNFFIDNGFVIKKRSEVLGDITRSLSSIAIAGTHGKTTVSSMVAHVLMSSEKPVSAFLGGILKGYKSNFLQNSICEKSTAVLEADEFDRSFLQLSPEIALITAIDADHLDIYNNYEELKKNFVEFTKRIKIGGKLIQKLGLDLETEKENYTYSLSDEKADFCAINIRQEKEKYRFDVKTPNGILKDILLSMSGLVNVENAIAAIASTSFLNISNKEYKKAFSSFSGIRRRFEYQINTENLVYIDDYAHHPEELKAVISSVRDIYPNKKITGIFQPHLYSRTQDFADEFAHSLSLLDELILLDIYPAREEPIEGVTSKIIFDKVEIEQKKLCKKEELLEKIKDKKVEILLTLGAGNIDRLVEPLREYLVHRAF